MLSLAVIKVMHTTHRKHDRHQQPDATGAAECGHALHGHAQSAEFRVHWRYRAIVLLIYMSLRKPSSMRESYKKCRQVPAFGVLFI